MSQKLTVKDVMSKPVSIAKSALIPEALSKMLENGIDHAMQEFNKFTPAK